MHGESKALDAEVIELETDVEHTDELTAEKIALEVQRELFPSDILAAELDCVDNIPI